MKKELKNSQETKSPIVYQESAVSQDAIVERRNDENKIPDNIYERYVEEFTDEIKTYIRMTKFNIPEGHGWKDILEMTEHFRVDMLSVLQEKK